MAKRRTPDTIEDALHQAIGFVGIDRIARMIGKSADMVRKFGDPDKDHHLQMRQGFEIDRHLALGGYPQPFAELAGYLANRNTTAGEQLAYSLATDTTRPMQAAAAAVCDAGKIVAAIEKAEADKVYTAAEVDDLCAEINTLSQRLPALKRALVARGKSRAGGRS